MDWVLTVGLILLIVFLVLICIIQYRRTKENYQKYKLYKNIDCCCDCDYDCEDCGKKPDFINISENEDDEDNKYTRHNYDRFKRRYNYLGNINVE
jgi:hypothetical protein